MNTPRAELEIGVNGGVAVSGGMTVPSGATLRFFFPTTVGWEKYRLEMYGPPGWVPPGGWTVESGDISVYTGISSPPVDMVLPANTLFWGKWMVRLIVNDGIRNGVSEREMFDNRTGLSMLSPNGVEDVGTQEEGQFGGAVRKWTGSLQRAFRELDAGITGSETPLANILGAVVIEDPANVRIARRLRAQDIDPDFNIGTFTLSPGTLVRRGDTLAGLTAAASYVSGPPSSGAIVDSFANGAAGAGAWTFTTPFASGSKAGSVTGAGFDGSPDPSWTATLTVNASGYPARVATYTTYFASDVYYGTTVAADIAGTDVYTAGALVGTFLSGLQRARAQVRSFTGASRYDWFLWPNEASYTSGTPVFKDQNGFTYATTDMGTVSIVRNGVTRTYRKLRSAGLLSSAFTVTVT